MTEKEIYDLEDKINNPLLVIILNSNENKIIKEQVEKIVNYLKGLRSKK